MNCRFTLSRLSSYVDSELPGDEMLAVRRHLDGCTSCKAELAQQKAMKGLLSKLPTRIADENLGARVLRAIRAEAAQPATNASGWPTWRMAFAVAGVAVMVFGVLYFKKSPTTNEPTMTASDIALDQDWNAARGPFNSATIPAGLDLR